MEKILNYVLVGGLTLGAFIIGKAYGIRETNEEYKKIIDPFFKELNEVLKCIKIKEK